MKKILIPVDGSEGSEKAVRFALSLVEGEDKEIILLNVQLSYNTFHVKRFFSQEQVQSFQDESSKEALDKALEITKGLPGTIRTVVRVGDPGTEICEEAKDSAVDFIVMGYRGLGAIKRTIMGSVATHVLHETPCPVVIVP